MSTANAELDASELEGVLDPPLEGVELPPLGLELLEELLELDSPRVLPVPETVSPTSPERETIVPDSGARSLVFWTAFSALSTLSWSLLTVARAEARFASRVASLCSEPPDAPLLLGEDAAGSVAVFVVSVLDPDPLLGLVLVGCVLVGVVVVGAVVVVVVVGVVVVGVVAGVVAVVKVGVSLALLADAS